MGFYHFLSEVESIRCGLGGGRGHFSGSIASNDTNYQRNNLGNYFYFPFGWWWRASASAQAPRWSALVHVLIFALWLIFLQVLSLSISIAIHILALYILRISLQLQHNIESTPPSALLCKGQLPSKPLDIILVTGVCKNVGWYFCF
jgi:hypothetical protein